MKHDDLQDDLARHLLANSDRVVWTNTPMGPAGSPRPDVYALSKSFAKFRADVYEIKVSVSDLRSDITSGKWQSYMPFSHAVWFAFPKGMAPLDLIPAECGVILRSDTGWRAARKPIPRVVETFPRDVWLKLSAMGEPYAPPEKVATVRAGSYNYEAGQVARKVLGDELGELYGQLRQAEQILRDRRARVDEQLSNIDKEFAKHRAYQEARLKATEVNLVDAQSDLAVALGLPAESTPQELIAAIHQFRRAYGADSIRRAIESLQVLMCDRAPLAEQNGKVAIWGTP